MALPSELPALPELPPLHAKLIASCDAGSASSTAMFRNLCQTPAWEPSEQQLPREPAPPGREPPLHLATCSHRHLRGNLECADVGVPLSCASFPLKLKKCGVIASKEIKWQQDVRHRGGGGAEVRLMAEVLPPLAT
ncbi:hypothetical protein E2C01_068174 [Portunus trituberculatus]|uniref:Uncharacterized protein n=1 Tax=Portunus trituberculatus TaxID=210409 RepID=A0A5B7HZC6_PORTR|nr:hypothetical protein [Portunus trituberculatus]